MANGGTVAIDVADDGGASGADGTPPATMAGFGTTAGFPVATPAAGMFGSTPRAEIVDFSSSAVFLRPPRDGGSTTHENGISEIAGRFSSGTNGVAVAEETKRLTNGGGIGGQLPPSAGDTSGCADSALLACGGV